MFFNESIDEWDNVIRNEAGATNAEIMALEAGLNLQEMPSAVSTDKGLLNIYLVGLQKEKGSAKKTIAEYKLNFEQAQLSRFFALTGRLLTAEECDCEVALMEKKIATSERLTEQAIKVRDALDLETFKKDLRGNIERFEAELGKHDRFKKLLLDGVTQRTAQESYQLLKERYTVNGEVRYGEMFDALDECHRMMDKEEGLDGCLLGEPFVGVDMSPVSNSGRLDAFVESDGYKSQEELAPQPAARIRPVGLG